MQKELVKKKMESLLEDIFMSALVIFSAFIYALLFPSFNIGLFILLFYAISFLQIVRYVLKIVESSKTRNSDIHIRGVLKISFCFLAALPLLPIFLSVLGLFNILNKAVKDSTELRYKLLTITAFLYSAKTQSEIFEPIIADWQEEYFQALFKKEIWKAHWINVRYTYAFTLAMWQKSPIGDLIEFVTKIAKQ